MSRISLAFKSFFAILFGDGLPADVAAAYGFVKQAEVKPAPPPKPQPTAADGALQILGILQRDARLIDFLMEDISPYDDEQVGAAFRQVNEQGRAALSRYVTLKPVIDGVVNTPVRIESRDASSVKLLGNVPADGKVSQGILRHNGWRAESVSLPKIAPGQDVKVLAPAEIEVE